MRPGIVYVSIRVSNCLCPELKWPLHLFLFMFITVSQLSWNHGRKITFTITAQNNKYRIFPLSNVPQVTSNICGYVIALFLGNHKPKSSSRAVPEGDTEACPKSTVVLNTHTCQKYSAQWIPAWYCDRMPPLQWNFLAPKYSTVNCQWYYNKVEAIGNDSNSAMKW